MSVIFKHWTPDRTFCFQDTQGQRDLREDEEATGGENRKNRISSDRLPSGVETGFPVGWRFGVVCLEKHTFL